MIPLLALARRPHHIGLFSKGVVFTFGAITYKMCFLADSC